MARQTPVSHPLRFSASPSTFNCQQHSAQLAQHPARRLLGQQRLRRKDGDVEAGVADAGFDVDGWLYI